MKDFFDSTHSNSTSFFDDAPAGRVRSDAVANSAMSASVDAFRQGVEISSMKHFVAGIVKIHGGEPGHVYKQFNIGVNNKDDHTPYVEIDGFSYRSQPFPREISIPAFDSITTMPSSSVTIVQKRSTSFDGVIDPLSIREQQPRSRVEGRTVLVGVSAALQSGNIDESGASDSVETVYDTLQRVDPYVEDYSSFYTIENDGTQHASTTFKSGYVEGSSIASFTDARYVRNDTNTTQDAELMAAMSNMTGSTDIYVSSALSKKSASCGWSFDTCFVGTDSITYGGRTY